MKTTPDPVPGRASSDTDELHAGPKRPIGEGQRRRVPAGQVFVAVLIALGLWVFLDAPALERAAEASPIGTRRSVALFFLKPVAATTRFLQLDNVRGAVDAAVGRDTDAEVELAEVPLTEEERDQPNKDDKDGPGGQPDPLEAPTREDPLRLVTVGDSFAQGVGPTLARLTKRTLVDAESRGLLSSGLTRPDFFNWPPNLRTIVNRFKPDVTVVMLGGNDSQTMTTLGSSAQIPLSQTDLWRSTYAERVGGLMDIATDQGGRVVWIGLPTMRDEIRNRQGDRLNDIYRAEAEERPEVEYVDAYELFSDTRGRYAPFLRDENGNPTAVRAPDGEHFTTTGYDWLGDEVLTIFEEVWGVPPTIRR
ncbi:MAG: DUF459 domain-containing protein [Actinomycetota bacterium]